MSGGYEAPGRVLLLSFSDPSFSGLEVRCRMAPIDDITAAAKFAEIDPSNLRAQDVQAVENLLDKFAAALVSWNLTIAKKPVPATREGVGSLDLIFAMQLVSAWLEAAGRVIASQASGNAAELEAGLTVDPF